jgi:hypothetical protein
VNGGFFYSQAQKYNYEMSTHYMLKQYVVNGLAVRAVFMRLVIGFPERGQVGLPIIFVGFHAAVYAYNLGVDYL